MRIIAAMNANKTISVGDVMRANGGAGPGFDLLRLLLALAIFSSHSFFTSQGDDGSLWLSPARPLLMAMVPMFFGLSGFLVTGSAVRTQSLRVFMTFRILRIVPALMTEVMLSAVILGALLTTLPLQDYFASSEFHHYFGNIIGWIRFTLPGVFVDNPMPGLVNVNLWTLKPEFACYAVMAGIIVTGLIRRTSVVATAVVVLLAASFVVNFFINISERDSGHNAYLPYVVELYFMLGIAAYHWRDYIPVDGRLFGVALAAAYVSMRYPGHAFVAAIPTMYCMLYLGMVKYPRTPIVTSGDYSYGIYLYGFPIQQTLVHLFPIFREWWPLLFVVAAPTTFVFAAFSWHYIEKPTLGLKRLVGRRAVPS